MTTYVMNIPSEVVTRAAHVCWSLSWANELEERGGRFSPGSDLCDHAPLLPAIVHLPIMWRYIGQIEQAWGYNLSLVFHHMGLETEEEQTHALTDLFLGCLGEGVSLADDHGNAFAAATAILPRLSFITTPIHFEGDEWFTLAAEWFDVNGVPEGYRRD